MEKHRGLPSSTPSHRTEHMLATARTQETRPISIIQLIYCT